MADSLRTKEMSVRLALALGGFLATVSSSAAQDTPTASSVPEIRAAIDAGNAGWIDAVKRADPEALAALFDEDGAILASGGAAYLGHEQLVSSARGWMGRLGPAEATVTTLDVWVMGATAYESGTYSYRFRDADGELQTTSGKYVVVWKRQSDSSWKIFRDIGLPEN